MEIQAHTNISSTNTSGHFVSTFCIVPNWQRRPRAGYVKRVEGRPHLFIAGASVAFATVSRTRRGLDRSTRESPRLVPACRRARCPARPCAGTSRHVTERDFATFVCARGDPFHPGRACPDDRRGSDVRRVGQLARGWLRRDTEPSIHSPRAGRDSCPPFGRCRRAPETRGTRAGTRPSLY